MRKREAKALKKEEADERREYRKTLSPSEQILRLDARLGKNIGAIKERKRLSYLINNTNETSSIPKGNKKRRK